MFDGAMYGSRKERDARGAKLGCIGKIRPSEAVFIGSSGWNVPLLSSRSCGVMSPRDVHENLDLAEHLESFDHQFQF